MELMSDLNVPPLHLYGCFSMERNSSAKLSQNIRMSKFVNDKLSKKFILGNIIGILNMYLIVI